MEININDINNWSVVILGAATALSAVGTWRAQYRTNIIAQQTFEAARNSDDLKTFRDFRDLYVDHKRRMKGFHKLPAEATPTHEQLEGAEEMMEFFESEWEANGMEGRVSADIWAKWRDGMAKFGRSPQGEKLWSTLRHKEDCGLSDGFITFYNKLLDDERAKRANGKIDDRFPTTIMQDRQPFMEERT